MKKILIIIFCLTALAVGCSQQKNSLPAPAQPTMEVGNQKISVEIAKTLEEKQRGLSFRNSLPENSGMLFDFTQDTTKQPGFWMKDTMIPLDFIWIKDNKILSVTANVPIAPVGTPDSALQVYYPPGDVDYVLEMNAGWAARHNISDGTQIKLP